MNVCIPQGSCLGPFLLLVYIKNLRQTVQYFTVSMYANEINLCYMYNNLTWLNDAITNDLKTWTLGYKARSFSWMFQELILCSFLPSRNTTFSKVEIKTWSWNFAIMSLKCSKGKIPWCANRLLLGLERKNQSSFLQVLEGSWISKTCQVFSFEGNFANPLYKYCQANLSILLFCLGLRWSNWK